MTPAAAATAARPCVLVFAGLDPSGGAGLGADLQAVAAQGAHALTVCTALTVQDNDRVYSVQPVDTDLLLRQAQALADKIAISAVKIGIPGSAANARAIAQLVLRLRERQPELPVVLDPVLASGHGDLLSRDDAVQALAPLLPLATVLTPNGPEAQALSGAAQPDQQAQVLRARGCRHVLITGGHGEGGDVVNRWYGPGARPLAIEPQTAAAGLADPDGVTSADAQGTRQSPAGGACVWRWRRIPGAFHGSGCTLAAAIAGQLALGLPTMLALENAQHYTYFALREAFAIAAGQRIPLR